MSEQSGKFQDISPAESRPDNGREEIVDKQREAIGYFGRVAKVLAGRVAKIERLIFGGGEAGRAGNNEGKGRRGKKDDKPPVSMSRRGFIKAGSMVAAGVAIGIDPTTLLSGEDAAVEKEKEKVAKKEVDRIKNKIYQEEQERIRIENAIALRNVLGKQYLENGRVEINEKTMEEIRYYWIKEYKSGGRQHLGLTGSLERMRPWYREIKQVFKENLPGITDDMREKLMYLAIPESHFMIGSRSKAGAKGEYQMMANTARGEGNLVVDAKVDERLDVLANAKGAAKTLFNYYNIAKNDANSSKDAWDLALAKFNGAYIKEYLDKYGGLGGAVKYKTYLKYRQERLNDFFAKIKKEGVLKRDLRFKESLSTIAKKYGVNKRELRIVEEVDRKTGKSKKRVIIPISFQDRKISEGTLDVIFDDYLSDSLENLNYPEKFYAVIEVLQREGLLLKNDDDQEQIIFQTIGDKKASWSYWKKEKPTTFSLKDINNYFFAPGTEASLQKLEDANPHIKNSEVDLMDPKYNNVKIYFLEDSVLDTQFRSFPTLRAVSKSKA